MTSQFTVSQAEIEAGIARARQLRSEYLTGLAHAMTKALVRRFRRREAARALADLPDYLLDDIGVRRDQLAGFAGEIGAPAETPLPTPLRFVVDRSDRARANAVVPENPLAA